MSERSREILHQSVSVRKERGSERWKSVFKFGLYGAALGLTLAVLTLSGTTSHPQFLMTLPVLSSIMFGGMGYYMATKKG
jgi:hypothetical protein